MWWTRWQRYRYRYAARDAAARDFMAAALPAPGTDARRVPFLAVDLETTALDPAEGEIASIGWVPIDHNRVLLAGAEHHLIAVNHGVGQSAVFHQISDSELSAAESVGYALRRFLQVARGRVLVFHNAELDLGFLNAVMGKLFGVPLVAPIVDTLRLEQTKLLRVREGLAPGELRLFACRERYGLPDYPAHNALTDAIATAELLLAHIAHRGHDTTLGDLV